jgi:hypothetical protein
MSSAAVERGVAARADNNFYTGGPSVGANYAKSSEVDHVANLQSIFAVLPKWRPPSLYAPDRQIWLRGRGRYAPESHSRELVQIQTTGRSSHQVLELIGELATQPRPSANPSQPTEDFRDRAISYEKAFSFPSETGCRVAFSDIETSSDEDLIEAGYLYFTNTEDPELATASRKSFLRRIGLAPD